MALTVRGTEMTFEKIDLIDSTGTDDIVNVNAASR